MENDRKSNLSVPIAIVIAGIIIAGALYFTDGTNVNAPGVDTNQDSQPLTVDINNVKVEGSPFIGDPNAPVVMAIWYDYQCPACQYGEQNLISPLVAEYVKTGKLKILFKDFAFIGLPSIPDSLNLAITAKAVWEAYPDKFYEWHKIIFDNQGQENTGWASKAVIAELTQKVSGIDISVINELIEKNSDIYLGQVEADRTEGAKFGVNATPSFIIGTTLKAGVPDYNSVKLLIDSLLN